MDVQDRAPRSKRKYIGVGIAVAEIVAVIGVLAMSNTSAQTNKTEITSISASQKSNCDTSYPDVCIPPSPPDLDCKDIQYRNFRVLPPDPHRFDGDHDGIGCVG